jgi:hypothetical protein
MNDYIVERVPHKYAYNFLTGGDLYYCHKRGFPHIPVFGSVGDKKKAVKACKEMNIDGRVRYS